MQEIDIAVARSGTAGDEKLQVAAPSGGSTASGPLVPVSQAPPPGNNTALEFLFNVSDSRPVL